MAYYQGGNFIEYTSSLLALISALIDSGLLEPIEIPAFHYQDDAEAIWQYLASQGNSETLEFVADAYWSAAWDENWRANLRNIAIQRLATIQDIDLVLAMGTWAGQDLVNDLHSVPTLALTSSDPIEAGIIKTFKTSGYAHVLVEVDPERYRRQLRLYHDILNFERLGVVYDNTVNGRVYSNLADLEYIAQERGFSLVHCHAVEYPLNDEASLTTVENCYRNLTGKIDALWIGFHIGEQTRFMPQSLKRIINHKIPTITSAGHAAVQRGVLMSFSYTDFEAASRWYAMQIKSIIQGAKPGELNQVFEMPGQLVINLETARRIGFEFPKNILAKTNKTYQSIQGI